MCIAEYVICIVVMCIYIYIYIYIYINVVALQRLICMLILHMHSCIIMYLIDYCVC